MLGRKNLKQAGCIAFGSEQQHYCLHCCRKKKSASRADVVTVGDSWLGPAIKAGYLQPLQDVDSFRWWVSSHPYASALPVCLCLQSLHLMPQYAAAAQEAASGTCYFAGHSVSCKTPDVWCASTYAMSAQPWSSGAVSTRGQRRLILNSCYDDWGLQSQNTVHGVTN